MTSPAPSAESRWVASPVFRWAVAIIGAVIAGWAVFEALGISVLSRVGLPHEYCYIRDGKLVWLHVISDATIGAAYVSISATLAYLVYRASRGIPFHWVFLAFGLFIVSCGLTHFMEVWVIWQPLYWLSGYVKVITAAASLSTAVALYGLVPKVFALLDAARESERRRIEIEQLNQELERFNYSVAHDLRSPLRGIAGFSHALREDLDGQLTPDAARHLDRIQSSVTRMDALISDLLRYATVGRQVVTLEAVPLGDAVHAVLGLLEEDIRSRQAEIVVREPLPAVVADPTLLQVVLQNLIGNGLKFVAPGLKPRVEITARTQRDQVIVSIIDNGLGIPAESTHRVFGMFERFHPDTPGTGIGLSIVHRAVERLGGQVGFRPAPSGSGSEFWVSLRADVTGAPARTSTLEPRVVFARTP